MASYLYLAQFENSSSIVIFEALLISGGSDGLLIIWNALETHHGHGVRDLVAKLSMKAHDGGVVAIELNRVIGGSPQLITIGADKTLAIWDTNKFKELRRMKPVPKLACHSVASWRHPRAPNLDILTCVKDSYIWAIEYPTFSALTRPLCDLYSLIPPLLVSTHKKLRVYCMVAHPLQPHLVATGTNVGVIVSEFDPGSLPPVTPLLMSAESRNLSAVCILAKELKLLSFQLSNTTDPSLGNDSSLSETGNLKGDSLEPLHVAQTRKRINAPVPHDSYSVLSVSSSGNPLTILFIVRRHLSEELPCRYVAIVWPDIPYFSIYKVVGLYGGALFGIAYRTSRRATFGSAITISTIQSMPVSGFGSYDDGFSSQRSTAEATTQNFQFFR
ncbi:hypothetical protein GOBAR_AA39682 [Gossypium barbadense]|uniref:Uncharacterized protein n=1 Tax=Gossypium barbadense TaxID=3634 RepID=A0A2P5VQB1_GOSBA|nr:hypothetical protein GOBAR_AA39682 [Gossypium barbadense]